MHTTDIASSQAAVANSSTSTWRDWIGIVASIGCAIHCAAMPFVIAYLPALGLSFLADESFHKWMALVCFLIAIAAFVPGIRNHRNWTPVSIAAIGLILITYAAFGLAGECCASCELTGSTNTADAACDHCAECEACQSTSIADATEKPSIAVISEGGQTSSLLSMLAPWITPVGGVMLVSAHLLNRRYGCLCGCCSAPAESND